MFVITGATGNTGSDVADKLLEKHEKVRVVGRDANRLERFTRKGAEAFVADLTDAAALAKALSGAEAVYAMVPPNVTAPDVVAHIDRVGGALASAIQQSGIKYAVVLSSVGAEQPDKTGPVVGLHNLEKKLDAVPGLNALYLRAGYFMENILPQVNVIKAMGSMLGPVKADLPLPMIATRDIGDAAAEALRKLDFQGKISRELQGARDVSYAEAAAIIGAAIGQPGLAYRQASPEQIRPALVQMGMSPSMADGLLELSEALNSGYMKMNELRSPRNTTPTTLETFAAQVFAPAYRGQQAARA